MSLFVRTWQRLSALIGPHAANSQSEASTGTKPCDVSGRTRAVAEVDQSDVRKQFREAPDWLRQCGSSCAGQRCVMVGQREKRETVKSDRSTAEDTTLHSTAVLQYYSGKTCRYFKKYYSFTAQLMLKYLCFYANVYSTV